MADRVVDTVEWQVPVGGAPPNSVQVLFFPGRTESALAGSIKAGPIEFDVPVAQKSLRPGQTVWINIRWGGADKVIYQCLGSQAVKSKRPRRVVSWKQCMAEGPKCTTPQVVDVSCLASMLGVGSLAGRSDAAFHIAIGAGAG